MTYTRLRERSVRGWGFGPRRSISLSGYPHTHHLARPLLQEAHTGALALSPGGPELHPEDPQKNASKRPKVLECSGRSWWALAADHSHLTPAALLRTMAAASLGRCFADRAFCSHLSLQLNVTTRKAVHRQQLHLTGEDVRAEAR